MSLWRFERSRDGRLEVVRSVINWLGRTGLAMHLKRVELRERFVGLGGLVGG